MIDTRFSLKAFGKAEDCQGEKTQHLAELLGDEIQKELDAVIKPALERTVIKLNKMGHNLTLETEPAPGEISYRDVSGSDGENSCKLRVAVDTVVSTGYADLLAPELLDD